MTKKSRPMRSEPVLGALASITALLMVAGGAFGAHGLKGVIPPRDLAAFHTGMDYGLIHSIAALIALLFAQWGNKQARNAGWVFMLGVLLFTGSLTVVGLTGSRALVWATPLGGLTFMTGWAMLAYGFWQQR